METTTPETPTNPKPKKISLAARIEVHTEVRPPRQA